MLGPCSLRVTCLIIPLHPVLNKTVKLDSLYSHMSTVLIISWSTSMAVKKPQTAPGPHLLPLLLGDSSLPMPRNSAKQRIGAREADSLISNTVDACYAAHARIVSVKLEVGSQ